MDLVLFGIQGSGKGSLGKLVSQQYGFKIFETGGELRKLSTEDSLLGNKIKEILNAGKLVSNDVVMEIIENFMNSNNDGSKILFDGIPRFLEQAETFDQLMKKHNREFTGILIDVPEPEVLRRLSTRRTCKDCKTIYASDYTKDRCDKCGGELFVRSDDNPESIKIRLKSYYEETVPVIERYKSQNKIIVMDGNKSLADCKVDIFNLIDSKIKL
jgi:adenylate kinase